MIITISFLQDVVSPLVKENEKLAVVRPAGSGNASGVMIIISVHTIFARIYLFFLPILSRPSFITRTPRNTDRDRATLLLSAFQVL